MPNLRDRAEAECRKSFINFNAYSNEVYQKKRNSFYITKLEKELIKLKMPIGDK